MTLEQLEKLKAYIIEVAQYEAARTTDDEASYKNLQQAERDLDKAFDPRAETPNDAADITSGK